MTPGTPRTNRGNSNSMSADGNDDARVGNVNNLQGNNDNGDYLDANGAGGQDAAGGGAANDGALPAGPAPDATPVAEEDGQNIIPPDPGAGAAADAPPADNAVVVGGGDARVDRRDAELSMPERSQHTRFAETASTQPAPAVLWRTAPDHGDINPTAVSLVHFIPNVYLK